MSVVFVFCASCTFYVYKIKKYILKMLFFSCFFVVGTYTYHETKT